MCEDRCKASQLRRELGEDLLECKKASISPLLAAPFFPPCHCAANYIAASFSIEPPTSQRALQVSMLVQLTSWICRWTTILTQSIRTPRSVLCYGQVAGGEYRNNEVSTSAFCTFEIVDEQSFNFSVPLPYLSTKHAGLLPPLWPSPSRSSRTQMIHSNL